MFLLGGTAFSGKTLIAHLLNQGNIVCLDEPDFHNMEQRHRGIQFLATLFPDVVFPEQPERSLSYHEAVTFLEQCERAISPFALGMKTAGRTFIEYARIYRDAGYPVIAVIRDIRDVLAEEALPEWVGGEKGMNAAFRSVWLHLHLCDLCIRYEHFVANPDDVFENLSRVLGRAVERSTSWRAENVHHVMFKLDRHDMLRDGMISQSRVGIWKSSSYEFSSDTQATAAMMGYGE